MTTATPTTAAPDRASVREAGAAFLGGYDQLRAASVAARQAVAAAVAERQASIVWSRLDELGLDAVKDATGGGLRLNAIEAGGITTVGGLLRCTEAELDRLEGVGPATATQALSAANKVRDAVSRQLPALPDPGEAAAATDAAAVNLLLALHHHQWVTAYARPVVGVPGIDVVAERVRVGVAAIDAAPGKVAWMLSGRGTKDAVLAATADAHAALSSPELAAAAAALPDALKNVGAYPTINDVIWLWQDYQQRASDYASSLELTAVGGAGGARADRQRGGVASEIADRVEAVALDCRDLAVSLRGYQEFGIKFAVAQERVILGDEMGLGKTIQALGAMTHLRATEGATHFLVVAPASITGNWVREIQDRSTLAPHLLHGDRREAAVAEWLAAGGIGVTSYETLRAIGLVPGAAPALLVVDEAHFVKHPEAARSHAVKDWVDVTRRVLFMSGTPLENRVDEFTTLVSTVNPTFGRSLSGEQEQLSLAGAGPDVFRERVSPVYLRRNQEDVLHELPERIDMEEWIDLAGADADTYRATVTAGEIMAMRQAATLGASYAAEVPPADGIVRSPKFTRLAELLEEYRHEGRKVIVFSYFRRVLDGVGALLAPFGGCGQITGDVPPAQRMAVIDAFGAAPDFAVLACQIDAAGVGLNLQAASVVVLMEPQLKPSTEAQAVARAHRMGQTRKVVVHRLLARDAVDESLVAVLAQKQQVFDEYARGSALKDASAEATDLTEASLVQQVVAAEQARLAPTPAPLP